MFIPIVYGNTSRGFASSFRPVYTDSADYPSERDRDLTSLMARFSEGDLAAAEELLSRIYNELHHIAAARFRHRRSDHTLQPTALVNEAYLKLAAAPNVEIRDRSQFFILASRIMREILVDHARAKGAIKRGGGRRRVTLSVMEAAASPTLDVLALEEILQKLNVMSPERAKLVELRYFGGLTSEEAAEVLGISRAEVARRWRATRAWLAVPLQAGDSHDV